MATSEVIEQPDSSSAAKGQRKVHVPGEPGIWVLLFGDMVVFAGLFALYLSRRARDSSLFASSQDALNRDFGALNTFVLLTSSLLVVFAVHAFRTPALRHLAPRFTLAGFAVGSLFVAIKVLEYREKLAAGITPNTNEFYMYYYVLTGLHLAHVVVGLVILLALSRLARRSEPTREHIAYFEGGGCFWHMVDLLWIVIFPLLFLVR